MCDLEVRCNLIEKYRLLRDLRSIAEKEGATETVKRIDWEIKFIKLILEPLKLPED